ncbi:MAG: TonB-dependent receptor [Arcobacteraceae bacterium]
MKRSLLILSVVTANALFANDVTLDEITITTATKTQKSIDGINASVDVITQKEIEQMGAQSLRDVLSKTNGITIQHGTFPSASSLSKGSVVLRGMGAKGTLILIDGRRVGGEVANPYDMDRIPASSIEKIEIVKGPMSTLYGADASGGVINILTKKATATPQTNFGLRYGQNGEGDDKNKNMNFDTRGKVNDLSYSLYVNQTLTTPYTQKESADVWAKTPAGKAKPSAHPNPAISGNLKDNYDVDVTYKEKSDILTVGGRVEYDFTKNITAGLEFNHFKEEREGTYIGYFHPTAVTVPAYNVPVESTDDNERLDLSSDLKIAATDDLLLNFRIYQSYYEKRNTTAAKYWQDMGYASQKASEQNGLDANVDVRSFETMANYVLNANHLLTTGLETRKETREGTVFTLANEMSQKEVDYKALYLQDEWQALDDLNIIFGARYDDISNANSEVTYKIGAVKNINKAFNPRVNFAQGYRTADIRELYIYKNTPTGSNRGADVIDATVGKTTAYDLKPEFTNSYEIGANGVFESSRYDVAFFHNDISDMIAEVNKGTYNTFENIPNAKTYGFEASFTQNLNENLSTNFNWMELRTKNKETNKELAFNPKRIVGVNFDYAFTKNISSTVGAKYIASQYYQETLNAGSPTQTLIDAKTNDYTTLNTVVNYTFNKTTSLYAGIDNITDKRIDDVLGSSSGRYFFTGVKITL